MGRKLYVGNLPYSATESALSDKFAAYPFGEEKTAAAPSDTGGGESADPQARRPPASGCAR